MLTYSILSQQKQYLAKTNYSNPDGKRDRIPEKLKLNISGMTFFPYAYKLCTKLPTQDTVISNNTVFCVLKCVSMNKSKASKSI